MAATRNLIHQLTQSISYGDDKSGKNDVEELKLFDVDDDK